MTPAGREIGRARRRLVDRGFAALCAGVAMLAVVILGVLLVSIFRAGLEYLDWEFLRGLSSFRPEEAGFWPAIIGSLWVCTVCAVVGLPLGVGAAVWLHEFAPRNRFTSFVQLNIANLAGVPSIVYGLIGLATFVAVLRALGAAAGTYSIAGIVEITIPQTSGRTVLAAGLTLMLVVLPIVMIATQEALRAVPDSLREGALALGATRWQMVRRMILPAALPGIMTGSILAMSRAIGETAPILVVGGAIFAPTASGLLSDFTAMPIQIFYWTGSTNQDFQKVAAAGIVVLLVVLLLFNAAAIFIRAKFQKPLS